MAGLLRVLGEREREGTKELEHPIGITSVLGVYIFYGKGSN